MMMKSLIAAAAVAASLAIPAMAQSEATPDGVWQDRWGTTFTFSLCGDGTDLCGTLNDIQGESRTPENLAYVDKQVVRAEQTAPNKWEGQIALNGGNAKAIVEQVDPNTIEITGCQAGIFCSTLTYERVS
jgi:uncharacterized protein (DUF2147 family)